MGAPDRVPVNRNTERARHSHAQYMHDGTAESAGRLVVAAAQVVIAMSVTVKHKRHQATANQQREQDTARYGDISVKWNFITTDMHPGSGREPDRQTQKREQR